MGGCEVVWVNPPPSSDSESVSASSASKPSGSTVWSLLPKVTSRWPCECDIDRPAFGTGCMGMGNGRAPEASLAAGDGVPSALRPPRLPFEAARRASRAALRCAAFSILKLSRFWVDHMVPPRPETLFSLRGMLPNDFAVGHGRSSSDDTTASESGVARRNDYDTRAYQHLPARATAKGDGTRRWLTFMISIQQHTK